MHTLSRRSILLGAMAAPFAAPADGNAQAWPTGTIKIVIPFPPGGSTDVIARLVQGDLQQRLGATVIIENRPGAGGSAGTAAVAKSPPDGNTWLIVFDNHAANPFVLPKLSYDTEKDLDPVLLIGTAPYVISTQPLKPFQTLADIIAAAKAKPDTVSYASVGAGSIGHLAMLLLSKQAGVRLVHVPYRGGGPAMNDTIAGHVDLLIGSTALSIPQIQAGRIKAVVQTGKARTPSLGAVPTVSESALPASRPMPGGAYSRPRARRGRSSAALPTRSRPACASRASPSSSPRRNRSRWRSTAARNCASSSPSRCRCGARSRASTTSRRTERDQP